MRNEPTMIEEPPAPISWEEAFGEERGPELNLMDMDINLPKIERLFKAAARGGACGSGGEQRSHRLAKLMSKAIEECAGTDLEAVEGAALMCYAAQGGDGYCAVRKMLDQAGYRRAAR